MGFDQGMALHFKKALEWHFDFMGLKAKGIYKLSQ